VATFAFVSLGVAGCGTSPAATFPPTAGEVADAAVSTGGGFTVTSSAMANGGSLPVEYTCDGASQSPPIAWSGAPAATVGYAVAMHHEPGSGDAHWYWVLYDIASTVDHIDAGAVPVAQVGTNSVNGRSEYAPPCSKGPGNKLYTITVYALSRWPDLADPGAVSRNVLLAAVYGSVLAEAHIDFTYDRTGLTS
jgi:phosphatidylethanolamine-binding protein (PEBP) family uncharacterized protein